MELQYIHEFCALAEVGNYLEAACDLDISQSTLSRHIQTLEKEFGVSFFTRTTRKVKLSDYGVIFFPYAKQMLEIEQQVHNDFIKGRRSARKILAIGSIPAMVQYDVTAILTLFQKANSAVSFKVTEGESAELKEMVRNKILDFAFVREIDENENEFSSILCAVDRMAVILPMDHPMADSRVISLKELRRESFLLLPEGTLMHKLCISTCRAAGFEPKICYTGYRADTIIDLVARGMGIALLNKRSTANFNTAGVVSVDLEPVVETKIDLIYLKDRMLTDICWSFLYNIKNYFHIPAPVSRRAAII
jgi:DNA-binding transcriptional LysR family regulator